MVIERRKIAGLIIFILMIGVIFNFPSFDDLFLGRRAAKHMTNEDYKPAYELLIKRDWDMDSNEYFYLLVCNFEINGGSSNGFLKMLDDVIKEGNQKVLQRIVDALGVRLEDNLARIFDARIGITFDKETRNYLSETYFQRGNAELAMALKESQEEIDHIYISYYLEKYEVEKLLSEYTLVPVELRNYYYTKISEHLIIDVLVDTLRFNPRHSNFNSEFIREYITYLDTLMIPKEMEIYIAKLVTSDYFAKELYSSLNQEDQKKFYKSSFVTNNAHYKFQTLINDFLLGPNKQKTLSELDSLKGKQEFKHIQDLDEIIDILRDANVLYPNNTISKTGILRTSMGLSISELYDIKTGEKLTDIKPDYVIWDGYSLGRSYFLRARYAEGSSKKETALFDSHYNELFYFGTDVISSSWLDDYRLTYRTSDGWYLFDASTIRGEEYIYNSIRPLRVNSPVNTLQVYSIEDTTYTSIEYEKEHTEIKTFYVIRKIEDNEIVFRHQLDCKFVGDDEKFIYGFKTYGNLDILISIDKETLETKKLPFVTRLYLP